jgi:methyl-accepting chemotaxis protein
MSSSEVLDPGMLRDIREGRRHISELGQLKSSSSLSINIAAPMVVADGSVLGGILAKVNLEIINQMTDSMALMQSGEAYLVDRRGVFVTHRDRRRVFRDNISKVPGVKQVISGRSGVDEYPDYRGISVLGGYQWLPRWQWGLLVEVDSEEAYEPLYSARRFLIVIALLVAAAVFLGTFLIARRIVHPLRELTAAVKAMAAGSFQQRLAIAGGDEIAYLSESFNQMAANISQNHTELRARVQRAKRAFGKGESRPLHRQQETRAAGRHADAQRKARGLGRDGSRPRP